jgi:hypothetical protein
MFLKLANDSKPHNVLLLLDEESDDELKKDIRENYTKLKLSEL